MLYPNFTHINKSHKGIIDSITKKFPLYCDFQFSNLISWSSKKKPTEISLLNGNLVVRMKEYSTDRYITMFMGSTDLERSLETLLKDYPIIERIPAQIISKIKNMNIKQGFSIREDINNHDYILDLEKVTKLAGRKMKSKRHKVSAFIKKYPNHVVQIIQPEDKLLIPEMKKFFIDIAKEKGEPFCKIKDELDALKKLLKYRELFNLPIYFVLIEGKVIGFTVNEIIKNSKRKTALGCFGKGLRKYNGIFPYLEVITAKHLLKHGIKYINLEEDMGFEGLRESKRLWRPVRILKKYTIQKKSVI